MKRVKKIDIHSHAVPEKDVTSRVGGNLVTPKELKWMYDQIGVEKGVLQPLIDAAPCGDTISMREARKLAEENPDVFIGWFCNIDPSAGGSNPDADLSFFLKQFISKGAKGIGEITCNLYFDDPLVLNLFRHCEMFNLPVLFHVGQKGNDYGLVDDVSLPRLENVLNLFPNLIFIGHSPKFWSHISTDVSVESWNSYSKEKVRPGGRLVSLMEKYPNLHADLSAGSGANAMMRDPEFAYRFLDRFADRVYFGVDICDASNINHPMMKLSGFLDEAMEQRKIKYDTYVKVCRTNVLNLLNRI